MKESVYNVYLLDKKEGKVLVYNVMHRSIVRTDDNVYSLMRNNKIDSIDDDVLEVLKNEGIVADDNVNELALLKVKFNRVKYATTTRGITVIPTHACNLACKYCYQGHGNVLSSTMSEGTIKRTIEYIKKNAKVCRKLDLNFYGGEPLLFPDIAFRIIEELKQFADENDIQFSVSFTTNGTLLTEEILEKLKNYNYRVQITFCGPKEIHDTIRVDKKGNGTYEKLMDVIKLLKKHDAAFHLRVDVDQGNYDTIILLLEDLKKRGFEGLYIGFCPISDDICYTELERDVKRVGVVALTRLCKIADDMGFKTNPYYIHNFIEKCSALSDNFLAIDPRGDVYKCIAASNYTEHKFGTLNESGDLVDINYEAYCNWTLRDPLLIEECVECKFAPLCGGGCALAAHRRYGSINTPGCEEKDLGEVLRTFIMLKYPALFEQATYDTIVL